MARLDFHVDRLDAPVAQLLRRPAPGGRDRPGDLLERQAADHGRADRRARRARAAQGARADPARSRRRARGVIFISHNLQDIFAVADRIVVLRRGVKAGERRIAETEPRRDRAADGRRLAPPSVPNGDIGAQERRPPPPRGRARLRADRAVSRISKPAQRRAMPSSTPSATSPTICSSAWPRRTRPRTSYRDYDADAGRPRARGGDRRDVRRLPRPAPTCARWRPASTCSCEKPLGVDGRGGGGAAAPRSAVPARVLQVGHMKRFDRRACRPPRPSSRARWARCSRSRPGTATRTHRYAMTDAVQPLMVTSAAGEEAGAGTRRPTCAATSCSRMAAISSTPRAIFGGDIVEVDGAAQRALRRLLLVRRRRPSPTARSAISTSPSRSAWTGTRASRSTARTAA